MSQRKEVTDELAFLRETLDVVKAVVNEMAEERRRYFEEKQKEKEVIISHEKKIAEQSLQITSLLEIKRKHEEQITEQRKEIDLIKKEIISPVKNPEKLLVKYINIPSSGIRLGGANGFDATFPSKCRQNTTLFIDHQIAEGIVRLTVSVAKYSREEAFGMGVTSSTCFDKLTNGCIGDTAGSYALHLLLDRACISNQKVYKTSNCKQDYVTNGFMYRGNEGIPVVMEVDMNQRTLCFFNDGKIIPWRIIDLPSSVSLGMSGNGHVMTFLSFNRVRESNTQHYQAFADIEWR